MLMTVKQLLLLLKYEKGERKLHKTSAPIGCRRGNYNGQRDGRTKRISNIQYVYAI